MSRPSQSSSSDQPNNIWCGVQILNMWTPAPVHVGLQRQHVLDYSASTCWTPAPVHVGLQHQHMLDSSTRTCWTPAPVHVTAHAISPCTNLTSIQSTTANYFITGPSATCFSVQFAIVRSLDIYY
jgi:hypothetical protein